MFQLVVEPFQKFTRLWNSKVPMELINLSFDDIKLYNQLKCDKKMPRTLNILWNSSQVLPLAVKCISIFKRSLWIVIVYRIELLFKKYLQSKLTKRICEQKASEWVSELAREREKSQAQVSLIWRRLIWILFSLILSESESRAKQAIEHFHHFTHFSSFSLTKFNFKHCNYFCFWCLSCNL